MILFRCCFLAALTTRVLSAQADTAQPRARHGVIDGIVGDTTLAPIAGATVSVLGTDVRVVTGENGRFRMTSLPTGEYLLFVRRLGFEGATSKVSVDGDAPARISFALAPVVTRLAGMEVSAMPGLTMRMKEFYDRKSRAEGGVFITREDIVKRNPRSAFDLLQGIPSIKLGEIQPGGAKGIRSTRSNCDLMILLDGLPIKADRVPAPDLLAGIEVYPGPASIPLQYKTQAGSGYLPGQSGASCGLVLMWTGDGR